MMWQLNVLWNRLMILTGYAAFFWMLTNPSSLWRFSIWWLLFCFHYIVMKLSEYIYFVSIKLPGSWVNRSILIALNCLICSRRFNNSWLLSDLFLNYLYWWTNLCSCIIIVSAGNFWLVSVSSVHSLWSVTDNTIQYLKPSYHLNYHVLWSYECYHFT
jgi:hypothetical protein